MSHYGIELAVKLHCKNATSNNKKSFLKTIKYNDSIYKVMSNAFADCIWNYDESCKKPLLQNVTLEYLISSTNIKKLMVCVKDAHSSNILQYTNMFCDCTALSDVCLPDYYNSENKRTKMVYNMFENCYNVEKISIYQNKTSKTIMYYPPQHIYGEEYISNIKSTIKVWKKRK